MSKWVTFSDGSQACHSMAMSIATARAKTVGIPVTVYHSYEYVDQCKLPEEQRKAYEAIVETLRKEELNEECAKRGGVTVINQQTLPYAASPSFGSGKNIEPNFCFDPKSCAGHGSCPKRRACSE